MTTPTDELGVHPLRGLLAPGRRLGWQFESGKPRPFPDSEPAAPAARQPDFDTAAARSRATRRAVWVGQRGLGVAALVCGLGWLAHGSASTSKFSGVLLHLGGIVGFCTLVVLAFIYLGYRLGIAWAARPTLSGWVGYRWKLRGWRHAKDAFDAAEQDRLATVPQWRAAGPDSRDLRLDVFGGSHWGWRGLLTVAGAGYLAQYGPSLVVDLTGQEVAQDLRELCIAAGRLVDVQMAPDDCDVLDGLTGADLAGVIVEAAYGDSASARTDRAKAQRILTAVVRVLGENITLPRIADAIQVLLQTPGAGQRLTGTERATLLDELFADDTRAHLLGPLSDLDAYLDPLRTVGNRRPRQAGPVVTIVATPNTMPHVDLVHDLILVGLTRRIVANPTLCRILVVAGADHLPERYMDRLADVCAHHEVRLIVLWRHLRDAAARARGAGSTVFMRLGAVEEATLASEFIGREHRFVLSSLTKTTGGSKTVTDSTGYSESVSTGTSRGTTRSGSVHALIDEAQSWSRSDQTSRGRTVTVNTGISTALTEQWNDAEAVQRVYEYAVEPTVLQGLPDYALLLARHTPAGTEVLALDCNPAIVTLPDVEMNPQPAQPASPTDTTPVTGWAIGQPAIGHTPPPASFPLTTPDVPAQQINDQMKVEDQPRWDGNR